tara:strand:- start:249 stop:512 length:264 start_codon:yes stop_codon:yes gene_type:complete
MMSDDEIMRLHNIKHIFNHVVLDRVFELRPDLFSKDNDPGMRTMFLEKCTKQWAELMNGRRFDNKNHPHNNGPNNWDVDNHFYDVDN